MSVFSQDGVSLYFELRGNGPRLVFHPGTLSDLRVHPTVFDSPLARHFEILSFDPRGIGQSNSPDASPTMFDYAQDLKRLMEHIGWQDALFIGESFGGMVLQEFALLYPQAVQRLVLIVTSSGGPGGASFPLHKYDIEAMNVEEKVNFFISAGDSRMPSSNNEQIETALYTPLRNYYKQVCEISINKPEGALCRSRQLQARKGHDTFERLPELRVGTLICGGRYDRIAPFENQKALFQQINESRLGIFEGGHHVLWQDTLIWGFILSFLKLT
ncbi:alpha/beta fold hydrolase [Microbulbifer variabilis]|uniref:alpha/beta fold hydrolase n=1 Tax=Microbulbifer variabilis TaxID=266805 RepID=UPI00036D4FA4|nr:alpha/beta hydrolase [Microbulbifer variabilis]